MINLDKAYHGVILATLLALSISAVLFGAHLFDQSVPAEEDVRAHIAKIDLLYDSLADGKWPFWSNQWYEGYLPFQHYPPLFYLLAAFIMIFTKQAVIAYKLLMFFTLVSNGLAIYFFSRRWLKSSVLVALVSLFSYEASAPLLVNYGFGTGPNLLGWSMAVVFLTFYGSHVADNSGLRADRIALDGFFLGLILSTHPFPLIFAVMGMFIIHFMIPLYRGLTRKQVLQQLIHLGAVSLIGCLMTMYYWLPAFMTREYVSPVLTYTGGAWPAGVPYLLIILVVSLLTAFAIRSNSKDKLALDLVTILLVLTTALGFGATRLLPAGLGSLVHEFRFATIAAPFFGIAILSNLVEITPPKQNRHGSLVALVLSLITITSIFCATNYNFMVQYFEATSRLNLPLITYFPTQHLLTQFLYLGLLLYPLYVIFNRISGGKEAFSGNFKKNILIVSIVLVVSIIPMVTTYRVSILSRLFWYKTNYLTSAYVETAANLKSGRFIIPIKRGYLMEGDSLVTFGQKHGVETVNGPYNQGDPKFFKHTVHLEWEERWLEDPVYRENLMQETGSRYIFIREGSNLPSNLQGLKLKSSNSYGLVLEVEDGAAFANHVTPVLLDTKNNQQITDILNILTEDGFRLVLVNADELGSNRDYLQFFKYAVVDRPALIEHYREMTVFQLQDLPEVSVDSEKNGKLIKVNAPFRAISDEFFYKGETADVASWRNYDTSATANTIKISGVSLSQLSEKLKPYLKSLDYSPLAVKIHNNEIGVLSQPGFTLLKYSYFPYWNAGDDILLPTSQGFMLVYSAKESLTLSFNIPAYYWAAAVISAVAALAVLLTFPVVKILRNRRVG